MNDCKTRIKRTLIAVVNGRGGIGKTYVSTLVAQWLAFHNIPRSIVDCDDTKSLSGLMPDAKLHSVKTADGVETIIYKIRECEVTLADFPAGITAEVTGLFATTEFKPGLAAINGRLVIVMPILANDLVTLDEMRRLVTDVKDTPVYVVAKNEHDGNDFASFDRSTVARDLEGMKSPVIRVPSLNQNLRAILNENRATLAQYIGWFWELKMRDPQAAFPHTVSSQVATTALREMFSQLDKLAHVLLPTSLAEKLVNDDSGDAIKNFGRLAWSAKQPRP